MLITMKLHIAFLLLFMGGGLHPTLLFASAQTTRGVGGGGIAISFPMCMHAPASASNMDYECPLPSIPPLTVQTIISSSGSSNTLSFSTSVPSATGGLEKYFLCLLSLLAPGTYGTTSVRKPVTRTYGGRVWEVKAVTFSEKIAPPVYAVGKCLFTLPPASVAGGEYILTLYYYLGDAR